MSKALQARMTVVASLQASIDQVITTHRILKHMCNLWHCFKGKLDPSDVSEIQSIKEVMVVMSNGSSVWRISRHWIQWRHRVSNLGQTSGKPHKRHGEDKATT